MNQFLFTIVAMCLSIAPLTGQDTFSIVAVDSVTGEVGSAGASCLDNSQIAGGVLIISDPHPGRGVIHTQAYWLAANQNNASTRMDLGDSPEQIIYWLTWNDVQSNPTRRQYGIADFDSSGSPRADAYTGINCDDYKNHIIGPYYAIQGNILLGQEILDSMESRFLDEPGGLACKLMAALQGANVAGADTRCLSEGVSSLSSFVRVARPEDTTGTFYMDLAVVETPFGVEPIDSLQTLFDNFMAPLTPTAGFTHVESLLSVDFSDASAGATSVSWNFGDGSGDTTSNPQHSYASEGTYNVCLTAYYECLSETYCDSITVIATGVKEHAESQQLSVYPNPGGATFTVTSGEALQGAVLTVLNEGGREVIHMSNLSGNTVTLNLKGLPKGLYLLRISAEAEFYAVPIILE